MAKIASSNYNMWGADCSVSRPSGVRVSLISAVGAYRAHSGNGAPPARARRVRSGVFLCNGCCCSVSGGHMLLYGYQSAVRARHLRIGAHRDALLLSRVKQQLPLLESAVSFCMAPRIAQGAFR